MSLPEPEVLTSIISRVFRVEDITTGDEQKGWFVRYRGYLTTKDSAGAYDLIAQELKPHGLMPLFRKEDNLHLIYIVNDLPEVKQSSPVANIILFLLTTVSVMLAGAEPARPYPTDPSDIIGVLKVALETVYTGKVFTGWPFALALLSILLAHEFGHYLMARRHKTAATLPFFLPLPLSPLGTLGAFIMLQAIPKNKRTLFDTGVAGPLAGMIVAFPVLLLGLSLSELGPVVSSPGSFIEGNSLLYLLSKYIVFGQLLPTPAAAQGMSLLSYWLQYFFTGSPLPIGGTDVFIHPVAFAGWAGLLVTALNLIPVGTLDGGHVTYALFGPNVRKAFPLVIAILGGLGLFWNGWWLWAALLLLLGRMHAEPLDQITELDPRRRLLGWIAILIFILVFTPVPMVLM